MGSLTTEELVRKLSERRENIFDVPVGGRKLRKNTMWTREGQKKVGRRTGRNQGSDKVSEWKRAEGGNNDSGQGDTEVRGLPKTQTGKDDNRLRDKFFDDKLRRHLPKTSQTRV